MTTLAGLAVIHMFEVSTYGLKLKTVWKNKCKDNNNNYNNFIDLKSNIEQSSKDKTELSIQYMYKEDVITAEKCMNYLPLKITIFIRIISHCTQQCHSMYIKNI